MHEIAARTLNLQRKENTSASMHKELLSLPSQVPWRKGAAAYASRWSKQKQNLLDVQQINSEAGSRYLELNGAKLGWFSKLST